MARDLTPPPKRTPEELEALAVVTEDDLLHADETARQLAPQQFQRFLNATSDDGSVARRKGRRSR